MRRRVLVVGILGALVTSGVADLSACGDKFFRMGRTRYRGYAAEHQASILIYVPVNATPKGIKALEDLLEKAGHTTRSVKSGASLPQAFGAAPFDLVIAAYGDAGRLKGALDALPSRPDVLPILHKAPEATAAEAARSYPFLLRTHSMDNYEALEQIDRLMAQRLKAGASSTR